MLTALWIVVKGWVLGKLKDLIKKAIVNSSAFKKMVQTVKTTVSQWFIKTIAKVEWKTKHVVTKPEVDIIRARLVDDYYIILTRHSGYLSTFFISLAHFFLTGRWGYYSHVLMNLEDEVKDDSDFRLIEATGKGVHYSIFERVFDPQCSAIVLLKPKHMSIEHWTKVMDKSKVYLGNPYDTLFDLADENALSCVELIRNALKAEPDYDKNFKHFEQMITEKKNLTPQMFVECEDFEISLEFRH